MCLTTCALLRVTAVVSIILHLVIETSRLLMRPISSMKSTSSHARACLATNESSDLVNPA